MRVWSDALGSPRPGSAGQVLLARLDFVHRSDKISTSAQTLGPPVWSGGGPGRSTRTDAVADEEILFGDDARLPLVGRFLVGGDLMVLLTETAAGRLSEGTLRGTGVGSLNPGGARDSILPSKRSLELPVRRAGAAGWVEMGAVEMAARVGGEAVTRLRLRVRRPGRGG